MAKVFVCGASGYIGSHLIPLLLDRGHTVRALVRRSTNSVASGCESVSGDVLDNQSYNGAMSGFDTLVHLVGTPHPNPTKAALFRSVDLKSVKQVIPVAKECGIRHIVYLSVAHPAPVMKAYWQVRAEAEDLLRKNFTQLSLLRPWYVLGPGRGWAAMLKPLYALLKLIPVTRESAMRLDLVTLDQLIGAVVKTIENPPEKERVIEVLEMKKS